MRAASYCDVTLIFYSDTVLFWLVGPAGPTRAVPGVAAQTTPAQTVSWSVPITLA